MTTKVTVGNEAPDFTLVDQGFGAVTLSEFKGQKVVLTFFPAAFSGAPDDGCEMHLCSLKQIENAVVLGVSVDMPFANAAFAKQIELPYKLLSDPTGKLAESYVDLFDIGSFLSGVGVAPEDFNGVRAYPRALFVIDEEGLVTFAWIGEEDGSPHPGMQPPVSEILELLA